MKKYQWCIKTELHSRSVWGTDIFQHSTIVLVKHLSEKCCHTPCTKSSLFKRNKLNGFFFSQPRNDWKREKCAGRHTALFTAKPCLLLTSYYCRTSHAFRGRTFMALESIYLDKHDLHKYESSKKICFSRKCHAIKLQWESPKLF